MVKKISCNDCIHKEVCGERDPAITFCSEYIANKKGKWVVYMTAYKGDEKTSIRYMCSECGRQISYVHTMFRDKSFDEEARDFLKDYPYCHCGARMET